MQSSPDCSSAGFHPSERTSHSPSKRGALASGDHTQRANFISEIGTFPRNTRLFAFPERFKVNLTRVESICSWIVN